MRCSDGIIGMTSSEQLSASFYDQLGSEGLAARTNPAWDAQILHNLGKLLSPAQDILDVGCGYGRIARINSSALIGPLRTPIPKVQRSPALQARMLYGQSISRMAAAPTYFLMFVLTRLPTPAPSHFILREVSAEGLLWALVSLAFPRSVVDRGRDVSDPAPCRAKPISSDNTALAAG